MSRCKQYRLLVGYVTGEKEDYISPIKEELLRIEKELVKQFEDQIEFTQFTEVE